ncbi:MAG: hypothetical protein HY796_03895 [Elusimicrobia bacterium]|nr:hypothetical protein [Elusimicrobiota bacterium]
MKRLKKIILILFCTLTSAFILLLLIGIFATGQENIEDRILENVKIDYKFTGLDELLWDRHGIMIVMEIDETLGTYTYDNSPQVTFSSGKTTVRELLNAVVSQKDFVWRTEGDVIHIIAKSLDKRPDYQLNTEIEQFSETGNYADMVEMALGQIKHRNFPEKLIPFFLSGRTSDFKKGLCPFRIKARNITLRQLLDRIALESKGKIHYYGVTRQRERDGSVILLMHFREEGVMGLSEIKDPPEPELPCPKI